MSSNFTKKKITLNQSIKDKIEKVCNPFINQVRKNAKERQKSNKEHNEDFTDVEKYITQKSHLLKRPTSEIEERNQKSEKDKTYIDKLSDRSRNRLNITKRKRVDIENLKAKFSTKCLGEKGPVYEVDQERDTIIIYWNDEHPFYRLFIEKNNQEPDILNPICFLVYSFGSAELISKSGSDSQEIIENIRWDVGRNLAVLLKD
ncbi:MAG: hypothetical protein JNJ56_07490 [Ignavibacteria bacterium]|nr:hypothetical protein [Ignavibacteria bacterium]